MPARAMKRRTITGMRLAGALIAVLASAALASAETYPSHPVTMMVGFPPGGPTDTLARILADGMQAPLGQPVVVETLSGASGTLATGRLAGDLSARLRRRARPSAHFPARRLAVVDHRQRNAAAGEHGRADRMDQSEARRDD